MMSHEVLICMSTYNGADYIEKQISSILEQSYSNFTLFIRDDGSTDDIFINELKRYKRLDSRIELDLAMNVGVTKSFFSILKSCSGKYKFVFLCDQDDYWYPDRLKNTIEYITSNNQSELPFLSLCKFEYVDENLKFKSLVPSYKHLSFRNALVQNLATGCSLCLNNSALLKIKEYFPRNAVIHDWWIYLVISAFGVVEQEPNISIKYRQHSDNTLGGTTSLLVKFRRRIGNKLYKIIYQVYEQNAEFLEVFGEELDNDKRQLLESFIARKSLYSKIQFILKFKNVKRENFFDNIILRLLILIMKR